jgi:multicomponent Na+:H+ antiporter subunit A
MQTGMGVLALACVLFGIVPQWLVTSVALPAARSMGFQPDMNMTFLGLQTSSAGAPVTAGAVIALLALAAAGVVYALTRRPTRSGAAVFTGGDPLPAANAIQVEDFAEFVEDAFQPVLHAVNPDPLYLQMWRGINGLAQRLGGSADRLEQRPYGFLAAAAAVVVLVIWLL